MKIALEFLISGEWKMGCGQCPDCCGCKPGAGWWTELVGHKPDCKRAKAIEDLGGTVEWERENDSRTRREHLAGMKAMFQPKS